MRTRAGFGIEHEEKLDTHHPIDKINYYYKIYCIIYPKKYGWLAMWGVALDRNMG